MEKGNLSIRDTAILSLNTVSFILAVYWHIRDTTCEIEAAQSRDTPFGAYVQGMDLLL
jgi:hypothetical protein